MLLLFLRGARGRSACRGGVGGMDGRSESLDNIVSGFRMHIVRGFRMRDVW